MVWCYGHGLHTIALRHDAPNISLLGVAQGPTADRRGGPKPPHPTWRSASGPWGTPNHAFTELTVFKPLLSPPLGEGSPEALPAGSKACPLAGGWRAPVPQVEAGEAGRVLALGGRMQTTICMQNGWPRERAGRVRGPACCPPGCRVHRPDGQNTMRLRRWKRWYLCPNWWGCHTPLPWALQPHSPIGGTELQTRQGQVAP